METSGTIKSKIHNTIDGLSQDKLKMVLNFLDDLLLSDDDVTQALLKDPDFRKDYMQAKEDIRNKNTVSWDDIRRNV